MFLKDITVLDDYKMFKSVKGFVDHFRANPQLIFDSILE